jgi:hypothetical protein
MEGAVRSGLAAAIELRRTVLTPGRIGEPTLAALSEPNASASTMGVSQ